jgi:hypothetical protein
MLEIESKLVIKFVKRLYLQNQQVEITHATVEITHALEITHATVEITHGNLYIKKFTKITSVQIWCCV